MSNLFIKFLPVEGEIKGTDYYKYPEYPEKLFRFYEPWDYKKEKAYKVAPHLCSQDIQADDTYLYEGREYTALAVDEDWVYFDKDDSMMSHDILECYKVIGPISPDATWVTDGMEVKHEDYHLVLFEPFLRLRCPSSPNHFH